MPRDSTDRPRPPNPRKRLGQHFLSDPHILGRIVDALAPLASDTVVEIGPGHGSLTEHLAARARRVVAVELDRALAALLRDRFAGRANVEIVEADALEVDLSAAGGPGYLVAANVPYYITTPLLFHALAWPRPARAVFLVQREVAERIAAEPGSESYGALSVNVQSVARAESVFRVAPGAFHPPPTVESALVRVTPLERPLVGQEEEQRFRRLVQGAFGLRRKQMRRVVRTLTECTVEQADRVLSLSAIDPEARPEVLSPESFVRLLHAVQSHLGS